MLGSVDRSHVFRLIDALAQGDGKSVVDTVDALRLNGMGAASTLEEMSLVLQRMAVLQSVPGVSDDGDPDVAEITRLALALPADETQLLYSLCLHGRQELGLAPDDYAALTMVLLRLLAFKPQDASKLAEKKTLKFAEPQPPARADSVAPAAAPVRQAAHSPTPQIEESPLHTAVQGRVLPVVDKPATKGAAPAYATATAPKPQPVVAVPVRVQPENRSDAQAERNADVVLVPTEEGTFWHQTVQQLVASEAVAALVRELALQSQLLARDTGQWQLRVERESLNTTVTRERLQAALKAAGHDVALNVEVGRVTDSPARRNAAAAAEKQLAAEKIIFDDPFVQSMMRDFGAKVVPGSIKPL